MKSDNVIIDEGMKALSNKLNLVEVEKFIVLFKREGFDYTIWREKLWEGETVRTLSEKAQKYFNQKKEK